MFPGAGEVLAGNGLVGLRGYFWQGGQVLSENAASAVAREAWKVALEAEVHTFRDETLRAMNAARPGHWIEDTEQVVKVAGERFGQRALEKLLPLRVQAGEDAFSPGGPRGVGEQGAAAGAAPDGGGARDRKAANVVAGRTRNLRARR